MQTTIDPVMPLSELMLALTMALDMTEGQPPEHCIRCCWIGMHIGEEIGLTEQQLYDLFFTLLLKDAGCSSNAARICELYLADDLTFKRNYKTVGTSLSSAINFVVKNAGAGQSWMTRISTTIDILKNGTNYAQELIETRCTRGAEVARELRFSEDVAQGVHSLDEHWDGSGKPEQLKHEQIPLYSRIALLAQVVDVFQFEHDLSTALDEVKSRSGKWFDPRLVDAFVSVSQQLAFCQGLNANDICQRVMNLAPAQVSISVNDEYFDCIVTAFGKIVDSKSPYTAGHSERVAVYTDLIAEELGIEENERKWLKRAALLHDLGKLGISNTILDKPDKLNDEEWETVKTHSALTEQILLQISPFQSLAKIAGAHHEKLDGTGYPKRLSGDEISLMTRIITTADIFDAITAERPYRGAIPIPKTLQIMEENLHTAIDERCFNALKIAIHKLPSHYLSSEVA
ncbi:HD-GYP domain-containing protein [Vibrio aestuarianus]|uniref:3'3'-cGAMP-specific phosphodiesterase 3 n=1 Tax=Vibrio aestuarianus TaxID=28171 RepID=A0ABM9FNP2_9VIBR|nr:HD-GYP domain-containing protein [Vibrio aestuarianus]MDE1227679.1 HD-GYP domain-containing protein [Vibrio aestuarianus]MDE1256151.1 HD-GYP domain-containing protein [Vibrio aestuarianus]MDE1273251.1 HD-GYP domain-containing protein [Vibrio aestuarianus]MDE1294662.1 HD-GYP domain-containing protein [Vibrio aestuarianus]MDE1308776.1 HD-GYP domain-containing protein [Vibrio aestuarianus]